MINSEYTDKMNLFQRTANLLNYVGQSIGTTFALSYLMDPVVRKYVDPSESFLSIGGQSSMWLIRTDFAFEYPRPLMPNVKFIGGFHCKEAAPLPAELEEFASSADAGLIVFSMGSMVRSMHSSKANRLAAAFAKLPQKVIWRYAGQKPKSLGNNTKIMEWIPQNDLIGHKNTILFVTHGGT